MSSVKREGRFTVKGMNGKKTKVINRQCDTSLGFFHSLSVRRVFEFLILPHTFTVLITVTFFFFSPEGGVGHATFLSVGLMSCHIL